MPTWDDISKEFERRVSQEGPGILDIMRRERLTKLAAYTGRPVVVYAVDFLNQSGKARAAAGDIQISWADKDGFVEVTHDLPAGPLDLLVHSPGGDPLAAESIVALIRSKFTNVRVFVPNIAKSAATMIALSANVIAMDERGELGPIDPQMIIRLDQQITISPAQAVLDQFERASKEVKADPSKLPVWLPLLRQYGPSLLVESQNAIDLSKTLVAQWLQDYMFAGEPDANAKADEIVCFFGEHNNFKAHGRRVGINNIPAGVKVQNLNDEPPLRDLIWELYTTISLTFDHTGVYKMLENSLGQALFRAIQPVQLVGPMAGQPIIQQPGNSQPAPARGVGSPGNQPMTRQQRRAAERAAKKR